MDFRTSVRDDDCQFGKFIKANTGNESSLELETNQNSNFKHLNVYEGSILDKKDSKISVQSGSSSNSYRNA